MYEALSYCTSRVMGLQPNYLLLGQMGVQYPSVDAAIQAAGRSAALMNTDHCDPTCREVKSCNCAHCAVNKAAMLQASAGKTANHIEVPASHQDVFCKLRVKIMRPFKNAIATIRFIS